MPRIPVKVNQLQGYSVTGGTLHFDLSKVQSNARLAGNHMHVAGFKIKVNASIKQAATTGPAVKAIDLPQLITGVTLVRDASDPQTTMLPQIPGYMIFNNEIVRSGGCIPRALPADIAANSSSSAVVTAEYFEVFLWLDSPLASSEDDTIHDGCWPLVAFANGYMDVYVGNIGTIWNSSSLSLDTTNPNNVDVDLILVPKDVPQAGMDVRWQVVQSQSSQNASITGQIFPLGRYLDIVYCPSAIGNGGGDTITKATIMTAVNGGQPLVFPSWRGPNDYHNDWLQAGGFNAVLDSRSPANPANGPVMAVIKAVPPHANKREEIFQAGTDFGMDVTTGSNLTNHHAWLIRRIFASSAQEHAKIAAASGIKGGVARPAKTQTGRQPNPRRRALHPTSLVPTGK